MTVHGAKGLEAPVVILADATADPARLGRTPITVDLEIAPSVAAPALRPRKEERGPPFDELILAEEKRDREEHWRLLYVAMTRAADRLIVTGVAPKPKKDGSDPRPANCWHLAVERAMGDLGAIRIDVESWGVGLRYGSADPGKPKARRGSEPIPNIALPEWALAPAPVERRPPQPLAPSAIAVDDEAAPPPSEAMRAAALRGTWIHQLLERLASVEKDLRPRAADKWLECSAGLSSADARQEIVDQVCAILSNERFAPLFGPESLGEAPLAATLPDGRVIAGTMDRLLVEENRISVIDFKTGKVPATAEQIPAGHRAQMSAYAQALRVIFPDRDIRAALLYTSGPKVFELAP